MDQDEFSNESIDLREAWNSKRYDLLSSLQNDSEFPENFNLTILKNEIEIQNRLVAFVEEKQQIHQCIEENDLEQLRKIIVNSKSKFHLNNKNESALYTAIQCKKFQVYAFLKSIGAEFKDEKEKTVLDKLTISEKENVKEQLTRYFPRRPQAHIHYLISKSTPSKFVTSFDEKVKIFYELLDQIPEISIILQVIQYSDYLEVVFDFDNENITDLCPHASKNTRGQTNYKEGRLYIAAGQNEACKILGTLAHELMHMAMEIIFANDCDPYFKFDVENENKFNKIAKSIKKKFKYLDNDASKVIMEGFHCYGKPDYNSELIARIPHILAQFQHRREWLHNEAKILMDYFNIVVLAECRKFIDQSYLLKPKNQIQNINEQFGEIRNVQKSSVIFLNVTHIHDFVKNNTENVILVKGESPWITLLRTLQGIYGKNYKNIYSNYIVVKFDVFIKEAKKILQTFFPETADTLIIYYSQDSRIRTNTKLQEEGIEWISKLLDDRTGKKIIFVIHNDMEFETKRILRQFNLNYSCMNDENITLNDLDDDSQNLILNKSIYFQGKKISITNVVVNNDEMKGLIDAETTAELILGDKIEVGKKSSGIAGLDNAYADMQEDISIDILTDALSNPSSKIFVFEEIYGVRDHSVPTTVKKDINSEKIEKILADYSGEKYLKRVQEGYTNDEFKQLCQDNPDKDIYWIQDIKNQEPRLILRKLYTPRFYIERKFMVYQKITVKIKEIEELSKYEGTKCLISNTTADEFLDFYREEILKKRNMCRSFQEMETKTRESNTSRKNETDKTDISNNEKKKLDISRIIFIKNEAEARKRFQELSTSEDTIYWLEKIGNNLLYKQSQGPLTNLKKHIDEESSEKSIVSESDFAKNIKNKKAFITSDDPGMGKSTTLAKLCHRELSKTHWIVKTDFKDISKDLKKINDIENLVALLSKTNDDLNNNLAKLLLQAALDQKYDFFKPVLIVLDGFDEVFDDNCREKIIPLLRFITKKTKATLFVTTRIHLKEVLENSLSTFAFEFQPMDKTAKKEFIMRYFKVRFNLTLNEEAFQKDRFSLYSEKFVSEVEKAFNADQIRFVGTPLQLYLLLEHVASNFKSWALNLKQDDSITFDLGKDILEVYSNFIDRKYECFSNKTNRNTIISLKEIIILCERFHIKLAKILTLNLKSDAFVEDFKGFSPNTALACGIVKCENDRLKFIHPTFQEYYAAKLFIAWLKKKNQTTENLKKMFDSVFVHDNYKMFRNFLECKIQYDKVSPDNIEKLTTILVKELRDRKNNNLTCLDVAIREEHVSIFNLILKVLLGDKNTNLLNIKCRFGDSVLLYACRCNKRKIVESVLNVCEKRLNETEVLNLLRFQGPSKETCLHHAAFHNNTEIIKLILDKTKCSSQTELYNFIKIKDDYDNTPLHVAASFVAPLFAFTSYTHLTKVKSLIMDYKDTQNFSSPELPYSFLNEQKPGAYYDYEKPVNFQLSQLVDKLKQKAKFSATSTFKTILQYFTENKTEIFQILQTKNLNGSNVIHQGIYSGDIDLIRFVLNKTESLNVSTCDMYDFLFSCTAEGHNILDISSSNGNVSLIKMIFNLIKEFKGDVQNFLLHTISDGSNGLHLTITNKHIGAAEVLVQYAKEQSMEFQYTYLTSMDNYKISAIEIAVELNISNIVEMVLTNIPTERIYDFLSLTGSDNVNTLHKGAFFGSSESVKLILDRLKESVPTNVFQNFLLSKADLNHTAFHLSAEKGHLDFLTVVLQYATELSSDFLYECLTSLNTKKRNPLHVAMIMNKHNIVEFFLENIPLQRIYDYVNLPDIDNRNVLHLGAVLGSTESVQSILNKLKETISTNDFQNFLLSKDDLDYNSFHYSAEKNHLKILSVLLQHATEQSSDFQYKCLTSLNEARRTPLHIATIACNHDVVKFILENIPAEKMYDFVSLSDDENLNPLHWAALSGGTESVQTILKELKEKSSIVNFQHFLLCKDKLGFNAFHCSAYAGHLHVLSILHQHAAELSTEFGYKCFKSLDKKKRTSLHIATMVNKHNLVEFILQNIPLERMDNFVNLPDIENDNALHLAAQFGSPESVQSILKKLRETISTNDFQNFLLSEGHLNCNAFHYSAKRGHMNVLSVVLQYAAELSPEFQYKCLISLNREKRTPLHIAMVKNQHKVVEFILENITSERLYDYVYLSDLQNHNSLHLGVYYGRKESVQIMLKKLKKTFSTNNFQSFLLSEGHSDYNPFHYLAKKGHLDVLSVLLQYATELSPEFRYKCLTSLGKKNRTPLHIAVMANRHNIVEFILENTPSQQIYDFVNLPDIENLNALHMGAIFGSTESVQSILNKLKKTISTNDFQNFLLSNDDNAFHYSAEEDHLDVLSVLLQHAIELSLEFRYKCLTSLNGEKRNPLHIAMIENNHDVVELILKNIFLQRIYDFVNLSDIENLNALHLGAAFGSTESVQSILNKLKETISTNDFQNFLLSQGHLNYNAFHYSAEKNNLNVLSVLLQHATKLSPEFQYKCLTSLNGERRTPLHIAVMENHHNVVEFILENIPAEKYDFVNLPDIENLNVLHLGAIFGSTESVQLIMNKCKKTFSTNEFQNFLLSKDDFDYNAFHYSAEKNHLNVLSVLLQYATELSFEFQYKCLTSLNGERRTPLHIAMITCNHNVVEFILENIPAQKMYYFASLSDDEDLNPLHCAALSGSTESVRSILNNLKKAICNIDLQNFLLSADKLGRNAFHHSAGERHLDVLSLLLQYARELSPEFQYECLLSLNNEKQWRR